MKVILAEHMGMCFGVRDAITTAHQVSDPSRTTIYGELVHNRDVINELAMRGFAMISEADRGEVPPTPKVLITAHGMSHREQERLMQLGKTLVDTTCPLVHRVHRAAQQLQADGYFVIVIGKKNHVEVVGIVGDLADYAIIERASDVVKFTAPRLGIVCQTTTPPSQARQIVDTIYGMNPGKEIRFVDTICQPTRARQQAAMSLISRVDALVVVGGRNSNNTRQLVQLAQKHGVPAFHVEKAQDLDPQWFRSFSVVGLTAGTSTPDTTIRAVHKALMEMNPRDDGGVRTRLGTAKSCLLSAHVSLVSTLRMIRELPLPTLIKVVLNSVFPFRKRNQ